LNKNKNDHCGVLILRDEYKNKVNLKWFYYVIQQYFYKYVYGKFNQGMLYEESVKRIKFKLPLALEYQEMIAKKFDILNNSQIRINKIKQEINLLINEIISF